MAMSGPQKIPGADMSLFFGDGQYSGSAMEVNCGCLHTTEGPTVVDYSRGAVAPTVTLAPNMSARTVKVYQHFDVDESARALVHASGMPATNTANVFQIELVGTCDPAHATTWTIGGRTLRAGVDYVYWPAAPDWALRGLADLMRWLRDNHGIPLTSGLTFKAYPGSYGANGVRMNQDQWSRFKGWCGHMHVPQNDHGDPGNIDINRVLAMAAGTATGGSDMALEQADIDKIVNGVYAKLTGPDGRDWMAFATLTWLDYVAARNIPVTADSKWQNLIPSLNTHLKALIASSVPAAPSGGTSAGVVNVSGSLNLTPSTGSTPSGS
jgi:hypothetical protein